MVITLRTVGDVLVFDIEGVYTREAPPNPTLKELVKAKLEKPVKKILFNLEKAEIESDVGVADIISSYVSILEVKGTLKFAGLSSKTRRLFRVICLDKIFDIYLSEKDALESFART